ncbi:unnamed protein product [Penicillium crustosum]
MVKVWGLKDHPMAINGRRRFIQDLSPSLPGYQLWAIPGATLLSKTSAQPPLKPCTTNSLLRKPPIARLNSAQNTKQASSTDSAIPPIPRAKASVKMSKDHLIVSLSTNQMTNGANAIENGSNTTQMAAARNQFKPSLHLVQHD